MTGGRKRWNNRLLHNAARTTVRRRDPRAVCGLTAITVLLALAGLVADIRFGSRQLGWTCYAAALVTGVILLASLFSKRLRITQRPGR